MAKIFGQLENAQAENIVAASAPSASVVGRLWFDTTNGLLKCADGSLNKTVIFAASGQIADGDVSVSAAILGTKIVPTFTAPVKILSASGGGNFIGLTAPSSMGSSITYTLPSADGSNSQVLTTNGSGVLSWASVATGSADTIAAAMTSTGANAIAATMNSTGTTSLAATMTTANANTIAGKISTGLASSSMTWTSYTPTITPAAGTVGSYALQAGSYFRLGAIVFYQVSVAWTQATADTTSVRVSLPIVAATNVATFFAFTQDNTTNSMVGYNVGTSNSYFTVQFGVNFTIGSGTKFTSGNICEICANGWYFV